MRLPSYSAEGHCIILALVCVFGALAQYPDPTVLTLLAWAGSLMAVASAPELWAWLLAKIGGDA